MPIFEYKCNACGHVFEELVMGTQKKRVACPRCEKTDVDKLISRTGAVGRGSTTSSGCAAPSGSGFS
ncbi:MAG: FmdB family zinc ribbon protein [Thermodesulfobacteriota bacterium]